MNSQSPGKQVAVNFHQLYPQNQPQLPNKNGTLGFPGYYKLGGGNSNIFHVHPDPWENLTNRYPK